jgi:hypothetical protein
LHLDDLGWQITEASNSNWDGLEHLLQPLKHVNGPNDRFISKSSDQSTASTHINSLRSPSSKVLASEDIKVGSLIKACLPGKKTIRAYKVEARSSQDGVLSFVLREMWRTDSTRTWLCSKQAHAFEASSLSRLTEVACKAPEPGTRDVM